MQTVMTTNNGLDHILLVDDADTVLSAWIVTRGTLADYVRDGASAGEWLTGVWPKGFDPEDPENAEIAGQLRTIAAYGAECGRNGVILDQRRAEFWGVHKQGKGGQQW